MPKKLTYSHSNATNSRPAQAERAHMLRKLVETLSSHTRVELDLEVFALRAARYREGRRVNGVIRSAQSSSKQTAPGKSCLRDGPREEKSVRFDSSTSESASSTTDLQPAHWIDGFHEPDGTHPSLVASGENENHGDRVRRAIHEADGTWSTAAVDGSQSARASLGVLLSHRRKHRRRFFG